MLNSPGILHARGSKLPTDLLDLTCVRYDGSTSATEIETVCGKLRNAITNEGRAGRIEGLWWQFSLTERTAKEPTAVSLLKISRDRNARSSSVDVQAGGWPLDE